MKPWLKLLPIVVIGAVGVLAWQQHQQTQARPDYESSKPDFLTAKSEAAEVIKVYDGDTLTVQQNGQEVKVRLCGIDAPELKQAMGKESRDKLRSLIPSSNRVTLFVSEVDRYGRKVAEVFIPDPTPQQPQQEKVLNDELVRSGLAYHYAKYADRCPNGRVFAEAEEAARAKRLGVWSDPIAVKPWDYRRAER